MILEFVYKDSLLKSAKYMRHLNSRKVRQCADVIQNRIADDIVGHVCRLMSVSLEEFEIVVLKIIHLKR